MIEHIAQVNAASALAPSTAFVPARAADIARFENLLTAPETIQPAAAAPPLQGTDGPTAAMGANLGEAILSGMERIREGRDHRLHNVNVLLEQTNPTAMNFKDVIGLQFELMQLNLHQEVTTKTADKTSQGVQTLFRNQ